ncbi:MAG TPA: histidinol dehydrogenase, partial [Myxococcota bacterium]|nr:histidinol dehydrogenase [Myxococcota bacterium]
MASRTTAKGIVPVLRTDSPDFAKAFAALVDRRRSDAEDVEKVVRKIIERVREGGDAELLSLVRKLDQSKIGSSKQLEVTSREWEAAGEAIDPADRAALGKSAIRVRDFHRKRIPSSWEVREEGGGNVGHRVRPLARVGIYVPGGQAV